MCVLLFTVFNRCSCSAKEIKRWRWKGMSNVYYCEKRTFSKLLFSRKGKNTLTLKSKKVQGILGGTFILASSSSTVFRLKNCVSDFF